VSTHHVRAATDRPLGRLGHLIVAIAEPHRDTVATYDEWFEAHHMYDAVLVGPGAFAAQRYVATRDLKALRYPLDGAVFADAAIGSFVALYYLAPGSAEDHFAWSFPQNAWLGATGRNNADRTLVLTWLCDAAGVVARDGHRVPPQVALDHPYAGIVMVWIERSEQETLEDLRAGLLDEHLTALVHEDTGVQQVQLWAPREFPDTRGTPTTPGSVVTNAAVGRQLLALCFLGEHPATQWERSFAQFGERLAEAGASTRLVAPFVPTVRGAGARLDELW
jgi:hypothetical protein